VHLKPIAEELASVCGRGQTCARLAPRAHHGTAQQTIAPGSHILGEHYDRSLAEFRGAGRDQPRQSSTRSTASSMPPKIFGPRASRRADGCMGFGDAGVVTLLAGTRQDNVARQALSRSATAIDPNTAMHSGCLRPAIRSVAQWWAAMERWRRSPSVLRVGRSGRREEPRSAHAWGCVYLFGAASTTRWPSASGVRLNPNFRCAHGYYGLTLFLLRPVEDGAAAASTGVGLCVAV